MRKLALEFVETLPANAVRRWWIPESSSSSDPLKSFSSPLLRPESSAAALIMPAERVVAGGQRMRVEEGVYAQGLWELKLWLPHTWKNSDSLTIWVTHPPEPRQRSYHFDLGKTELAPTYARFLSYGVKGEEGGKGNRGNVSNQEGHTCACLLAYH